VDARAGAWPDAVLGQPETTNGPHSQYPWRTLLRIPRLLERMTHSDAVLRPLGDFWSMRERLRDVPGVELSVAGPVPAFFCCPGRGRPHSAVGLRRADMRLGYLPPLWLVERLTAGYP
jgi:hypothetical protein